LATLGKRMSFSDDATLLRVASRLADRKTVAALSELRLGIAQKAVLSVRDSGRMIVAQQFTAGTRSDEIVVREADG